jgi:hypothetical protein
MKSRVFVCGNGLGKGKDVFTAFISGVGSLVDFSGTWADYGCRKANRWENSVDSDFTDPNHGFAADEIALHGDVRVAIRDVAGKEQLIVASGATWKLIPKKNLDQYQRALQAQATASAALTQSVAQHLEAVEECAKAASEHHKAVAKMRAAKAKVEIFRAKHVKPRK